MKKILSFLFVLSFSCSAQSAIDEGNLNRLALLELLEYAAFMESKYAESMLSDPHVEVQSLEEAEEALLIAYRLMKSIESKEEAIIDDVLRAYTLSRVGWFLFKTNRSIEGIDKEALLKKSTILAPDNNIYKYMYSKTQPVSVRVALLEDILASDPSFPEATIDLLLIALKDGDTARADELREQFVNTLDSYHPQLSHFDHSYPPRNSNIIIERGKIVQRELYKPEFSRMKFTP